jgi:hypothetical protein
VKTNQSPSRGGKKKEEVPVRGSRSPGLRPKKKGALQFKVGRWYKDREGDRLLVSSISNGDPFPVLAGAPGGYQFQFTREGRFFTGSTSKWDLVREIESPKGSAKGAARSRPKTRNSEVTPTRRSKP